MNQRFRANVTKRLKHVEAHVETLVQKTLIDMASSVVRMSPVDTGRFRANWVFGRGAYNPTTTEAIDKSGKPVLPKSATTQTTDRLTHDINAGVKIGQTEIVYITNSLPYAYRLEYEGWSGQAPAGMVRVTVANFRPIIRRVAAEIRGAL
jgi:hypothetical protein